MIIRGYNIELIRLKEEDIELVREKRNSPEIQNTMEFRNYITVEMQKAWFNSIDTIHNHYYIIKYDGKKCGLINGAQVDWDAGVTGSGGIFIWEDNVLESHVTTGASILLTRTSILMGLHSTYIKILRNNKKAIQYNHNLGYEILENQEDRVNQEYVLKYEKFEERTQQLREQLRNKFGETITIVADDPEHPVTRFLIKKALQAPKEILREYNFILPDNLQWLND